MFKNLGLIMVGKAYGNLDNPVEQLGADLNDKVHYGSKGFENIISSGQG